MAFACTQLFFSILLTVCAVCGIVPAIRGLPMPPPSPAPRTKRLQLAVTRNRADAVAQVSVVHKRIVHADVVIGKGSITLAELGENGPVQVNLTEPKSGSSAGVLTFSVTGNHNLGCRFAYYLALLA